MQRRKLSCSHLLPGASAEEKPKTTELWQLTDTSGSYLLEIYTYNMGDREGLGRGGEREGGKEGENTVKLNPKK